MQASPKMKKCTCCGELYKMFSSMAKTCGLPCTSKLVDIEIAAKKVKQSKKPAVKKPKTAAKLKRELWPIFSLHQKLVHSVDGEWCQCYTCDKPIKIGDSDTHGGHSLSKAANPNLYFDERCVRAQCLRCNVHYGGMHYEFNERLKQEIGMDAWQDMYDNRKLIIKRNAGWYLEKMAYYKNEIENLKKVRGF